MLPEERARQNIDTLLESAGWKVQNRNAVNLGAARGVAVREFPLKTGEADYLLFVDRKAIGAVEAKPEGTPLSGVEPQSEKYSTGLPDVPPAWRKPLPFLYESTGTETYFTNGLDPEPRSRRVFAFHKPETLAPWVNEPSALRARLRNLPPLMTTGLWDAQVEAITNLEYSLAEDHPRALIQMATGSGKTYTAVSSIYRLIKFGKAERVLFLVDRSNLGKQALNEFQQYVTPDDGRKFTELYNVQRLQSNSLDPVNKVVITTIQRLYSILSGEEELDPEVEEQSLFEVGSTLDNLPPKTVSYNAKVPIEYFDFIVTDECHRSIYNLWRQVLEYFDAYLTGLTATPSKQTLGFFNQNLVMEYSRQRAVADGVNVDGEVYRIRTEIGERGSTVEAGYYVDKRDIMAPPPGGKMMGKGSIKGGQEEQALLVKDQRQIEMLGDQLLATRVQDGTIYLPVRALCESLGLDRAAQVRRIKRDEAMQDDLHEIPVETESGVQTMQFLRLETVPYWLSGVSVSRVKPELREKLLAYKRWVVRKVYEAFVIEFGAEGQSSTTALAIAGPASISSLSHVRELGLALARLAEEQMALERQQQLTNVEVEQLTVRMNKAATVVGQILERVNRLEERTSPAVKALSHPSRQQKSALRSKP